MFIFWQSPQNVGHKRLALVGRAPSKRHFGVQCADQARESKAHKEKAEVGKDDSKRNEAKKKNSVEEVCSETCALENQEINLRECQKVKKSTKWLRVLNLQEVENKAGHITEINYAKDCQEVHLQVPTYRRKNLNGSPNHLTGGIQ